MPGRFDQPDSDDDQWAAEDPEGPQAADLDAEDDSETPTVPCPGCRRPVAEFADRCPHCGDWIVPGSGEPGRHRTWFVLLVVVVIVVVLSWLVL